MDNNYIYILFLVALASFYLWKSLKFKKIKNQIPEYIKNGALIIDVRSPLEFEKGSAKGSINIPLNELNAKSTSLDKDRVILLCCASGARSGMAKSILIQKGFTNVINIGPWTNSKI